LTPHFVHFENSPPIRDVSKEDNNGSTYPPRRRSKRQRIQKSYGGDYIVYLIDDVPKTLSEAYVSPNAEYWKEVVHSEMYSTMENETWEITDRPYYECKPIG
jgi:hypothetical protein